MNWLKRWWWSIGLLPLAFVAGQNWQPAAGSKLASTTIIRRSDTAHCDSLATARAKATAGSETVQAHAHCSTTAHAPASRTVVHTRVVHVPAARPVPVRTQVVVPRTTRVPVATRVPLPAHTQVVQPAGARAAAPVGPAGLVCDGMSATPVTSTMFRISIAAHAQNAVITGFRFRFSNSSAEATVDVGHPFTDMTAPSQPVTVQGQVLSESGVSPFTNQCSVTVPGTARATAQGMGGGAVEGTAVEQVPMEQAPVQPVPQTTAPAPTTVTPLPATGNQSPAVAAVGSTAMGLAVTAYMRARRRRR